MARTALTVQDIVRTGLDEALTAANVDGHSIANTGREYIHVDAGAGAVVVTIVTPYTQDDLGLADLQVTVPTNESRLIGPFPPKSFNQSDGTVHVDFDDVTNVTCAAVRLP